MTTLATTRTGNRITALAAGLVLMFVCLRCAPTSVAQVPEPTSPAPPVEQQQATPEQLDKLLGPIALYPDPLIAIILPASTVPSQIVLADRYVQSGGDTTKFDDQPWDASIKALAHYPTVLKWMDDNLDWTQAVGDAFRDQQEDVMKSIQQLRSQAKAAGNLETTPQQKIVVVEDDIRIVPAEPDVIYVPEYDPDIIYYERPVGYFGPMIYWGFGWRVGWWMDFDLDWRYNRVWVGDWRPGWTYRTGWGVPWRPRPYRHNPFPGPRWHGPEPPRPHVMQNAPGSHGEIPHQAPRPGNMGRSGRIDDNGWGGRIVQPAPGKTPPQNPNVPRSDGSRTQPAAPRTQPPATPNIPKSETPRNIPSAPAPAPPVEKPRSVFGGYGRGSDARDASDRGVMSKQPQAPPVQQQAPRVAPPVRQEPPQIQRQAPPPRPQIQSQPAPQPRVFQGGNGGAARTNSSRGQESRPHK